MTTPDLAALPADVREALAGAGLDALERVYRAGLEDGASPAERDASAMALAEVGRRDLEADRERARARRREAAAAKRAAAEALWMDAAHAHFLAAEAACGGNLTARGSTAGEPYPGLYRISDLAFWGTQDARGKTGTPGQASEEMKNFTRANPRPTRQEFIRSAFAPRKGEVPWDAPGWTAPEDAHAEVPAPVAVPLPQPAAVPGAGEGIPPAVPGDPGAAQRAQRRAARAGWAAGRAGGTVPAGPARKAPCSGCTGPGPACKHPQRWGTGSALAVPAAGRVIAPGRSAVTGPARAMPDAAELLPALLEEIGLLFTDYVHFPSRSAAVAVTVWAAHAAARDAGRRLIWRASPRLILTSEENGSGKSTVLDLLRILLQVRSGRMAKVTAPGLAMLLSKFSDTALPDEVNVTFGSGKDAREVQAILLAGYSRGGTWVNGRGGGTVLDVFGAAAMAGKDDLITRQRDALKDLLARSVIVRMFRPPVFLPQVDEDAEDRCAALSRPLWAIMGSLGPQLAQASRDLARELAGSAITDGDGGRVAQIWRPLDAIARVAGGPWPAAMEQARRELSAASGDLLTAQDELTGLEEARAALGGAGRSFWDG